MSGLVTVLFVLAALAFALGLKLLARPATARRGNLVSAAGMGAAVLGAAIAAFGGARGPDTVPDPVVVPAVAGDASGGGGLAALEALASLDRAGRDLAAAMAGADAAEANASAAAAAEAGGGNGRGALAAWIIAGLLVGTLAGIPAARLVRMTAMPEMVALFNGFGGMASLLVAWSTAHESWRRLDPLRELLREVGGDSPAAAGLRAALEAAEPGLVAGGALVLAALVGGLTFGGSLVAWGKLSGRIDSAPRRLPRQHLISGGLLGACVLAGLLWALFPAQIWLFVLVLLVALVALGPAAVMPIGGADMPVVISLLNSYSGIAACAAGFALGESLLIVTGALVGASGLILTRIMCLAMNRSLGHVLFSGFGSGDSSGGTAAAGAVPGGEQREATIRTPAEAYHALEAASSVVVVPGYGMAVAQAQHVVHDLARLMQANGTRVDFAIHPVAGRMPGHMSVLLAEADVPYEQLVEMDDVNARMDEVDVAIVIGANDTVNPAARDDPDSPLAGMPIIEVDRARTVFVLKRSLGSGYAGVDNPLFFAPNTAMILGDARGTVESLVAEFKEEG